MALQRLGEISHTNVIMLYLYRLYSLQILGQTQEGIYNVVQGSHEGYEEGEGAFICFGY